MWVAPVIATSVLEGVTDPYYYLTFDGVFHKKQLLKQLIIFGWGLIRVSYTYICAQCCPTAN